MVLAGAVGSRLDEASPAARERIDFLGDLPPDRAALCAEAADIGLLPMEDDLWNRSRFAIKFTDYLGAGLHVVCSEVGECGRLARENDAATPAGTTKEAWLEAVEQAVDTCAAREWPRRADPADLTWPAATKGLERLYQEAVSGSGRDS
jgi:hypothetical protein